MVLAYWTHLDYCSVYQLNTFVLFEYVRLDQAIVLLNGKAMLAWRVHVHHYPFDKLNIAVLIEDTDFAHALVFADVETPLGYLDSHIALISVSIAAIMRFAQGAACCATTG